MYILHFVELANIICTLYFYWNHHPSNTYICICVWNVPCHVFLVVLMTFWFLSPIFVHWNRNMHASTLRLTFQGRRSECTMWIAHAYINVCVSMMMMVMTMMWPCRVSTCVCFPRDRIQNWKCTCKQERVQKSCNNLCAQRSGVKFPN